MGLGSGDIRVDRATDATVKTASGPMTLKITSFSGDVTLSAAK